MAAVTPGKNVAKRGFMDRLQPRERVLVVALAGVFIVMSTFVLIFLRRGKVEALEAEIADLKQGLELVNTRGAVYGDKLAMKDVRESVISDQPVLFSTVIEAAQTKAEVSATNQEEKPPTEAGDGLRRRTIEFDLRSVTLEQLTSFLGELEANPDHILQTQELVIKSPAGTEDRLNVDVTLATFERVPLEGVEE